MKRVRSGLYPSFRAPPTAVHCPEALLNFNGTSAKHMTVDMYFNSAHGKDGIPRLYMCTPQFELLWMRLFYEWKSNPDHSHYFTVPKINIDTIDIRTLVQNIFKIPRNVFCMKSLDKHWKGIAIHPWPLTLASICMACYTEGYPGTCSKISETGRSSMYPHSRCIPTEAYPTLM